MRSVIHMFIIYRYLSTNLQYVFTRNKINKTTDLFPRPYEALRVLVVTLQKICKFSSMSLKIHDKRVFELSFASQYQFYLDFFNLCLIKSW